MVSARFHQSIKKKHMKDTCTNNLEPVSLSSKILGQKKKQPPNSPRSFPNQNRGHQWVLGSCIPSPLLNTNQNRGHLEVVASGKLTFFPRKIPPNFSSFPSIKFWVVFFQPAIGEFTLYTPENKRMEPEVLPFEKGETSEPNHQFFGVPAVSFRGVYGSVSLHHFDFGPLWLPAVLPRRGADLPQRSGLCTRFWAQKSWDFGPPKMDGEK